MLVSGGNDANGNPRAAERYDPVTDTWSAAGTLAEGRAFHSATLLPSGRVLVVGGLGATTLASAEQYDPLTNAWSPVAGLAGARLRHTASLLPSGKVLVVGGKNDAGDAVATAELFDPANGTWTSAGSLTTSRWGHTATLLPSGLVLVAGGIHAGNEVAGAELYDPATNVWSATGTLATARYTHSATVLPTGQVLIAGGKNGGSVLSSAELYDPARHANRDRAMKMLKAKLYEIELQKRNAEKDALEATKSDIGWGSQIRNYVLDQSRIKDLRTGIERSDTQKVLDGDLDEFIEGSLKAGLEAGAKRIDA